MVISNSRTVGLATPHLVELMNDYYDRSAGRWCDACSQSGSHHTDKHGFYVDGLMKRVEFSKS